MLQEYFRRTPQLLSEAKQVGVVYHFTDSLRGLYDILKDGLYGDLDIGAETPGYEDAGFYSYSFTRSKFLKSFGDFRLTLNGSKMSEKYKIIPVSEVDAGYKVELEERLLSKESKIDIKPYLLKVAVILRRGSLGKSAKELKVRFDSGKLTKGENSFFKKYGVEFVQE